MNERSYAAPSGIPALLVLLTTAVAKDLSAGTRLRSAAVVACVAIALFTFYTAVFPVLAVLLLLMGGGADRAR